MLTRTIARLAILVVCGCGDSTPSPPLDPAPCGSRPVEREHATSAGAVVICGSVVVDAAETILVVETVHYLDTPRRSPPIGYAPLALETDDGGLVPHEHLSLVTEVGADKTLQIRVVTGGPTGTDRKVHARIECRPAASASAEPVRFDGSSARLEVHTVGSSTCTLVPGS